MTTTEETVEEVATDEEKPTQMKRCFSGSGRFANRKWAPGGDATYLSRLRKAHLSEEALPDPWFIQEHGGVESENVPDGGWPQLSALDVARRLDEERGPGADSHWVKTLETASEKAAAKKAAQSTNAAKRAATKEEREAERKRQASRPRKGSRVRRLSGEYEGQEAEVLRSISPTQLLIRYDGGMEELVTDEDVETVAQETPPDSAEPEGDFVEQ